MKVPHMAPVKDLRRESRDSWLFESAPVEAEEERKDLAIRINY
jgi:hypothetical protein